MTNNLSLQTYSISFLEQVLDFLVNSNTIFLLLMIGIQAILIELATPGGWVSGFIGVICLALAVYGLGILSVNWFGIVFILTAFVLFIIDLKAPTHGTLTVVGTITLITGALVLFNTANVPVNDRVSVPLVIITGVIMGGMFLAIIAIAVKAQKIPILTGKTVLPGKTGLAASVINPYGSVQIGSELWSAELVDGEGEILPGTPVIIVEMKGFRAIVRKTG